MIPEILQLLAGILLVIAGLIAATYITQLREPKGKSGQRKNQLMISGDVIEAQWRVVPDQEIAKTKNIRVIQIQR